MDIERTLRYGVLETLKSEIEKLLSEHEALMDNELDDLYNIPVHKEEYDKRINELSKLIPRIHLNYHELV